MDLCHHLIVRHVTPREVTTPSSGFNILLNALSVLSDVEIYLW